MISWQNALRFAAALALVPVLAVEPSLAWGVDGHHIINRVAGASLPASVPAFLRAPSALDSLSYYAPLPDHWRGAGEPELTNESAPEHFIQLETIDALFPTLPRNRYDYIRALAVDQAAQPDKMLTAERMGMQPYQTDELWQRLKVGFRDYRQAIAAKEDTRAVEAEIIFLAGWLGHYVGDGSMPLHTSDKPNGWNGANPNGYTTEHHIHGLFESEFVHANVKPEEISALVTAPPVTIEDVFTQYNGYLHKNHLLVEDVYRLEKGGAFTGAGSPAGRKLVDQQLAAAATELRDLIYSAWIHSGDPSVPSAQAQVDPAALVAPSNATLKTAVPGYSLQIAKFPDRAEALAKIKQLPAKFSDVTIFIANDANGETWFAVRTGSFADLMSAGRAAEQLAAATGELVVVRLAGRL